ncbi:hypothetical protein FOCC_FOCC004350 [Frankliniella occidentalis]|nr:hypothetical protein FOCC_FOCC004350 [Frankliniella occidentalis]
MMVWSLATQLNSSRELRLVTASELLTQAPLHASAALRGDREDPTRLQYSSQVEEAVNQQINSELRASYAYLAMASFFALPSVALPGLESHCWSMSRREHRDALRLAAYQTSRGAAVGLSGVEAPRPAPQQDGCSSTPLQALGASLELQRCLTEVPARLCATAATLRAGQSLLDLHELASSTGDPVTCDFIATRFLAKQERVHCAGAMHCNNYEKVFGHNDELTFKSENA